VQAAHPAWRPQRLYRFSPDDYKELSAVFNGSHPETGDELEVVDGPPEGSAPNDLPPQPRAFVPDAHPEEIAQIAQKLRQAAGLPKEPTGEVNVPASAGMPSGLIGKMKDTIN